MSGPSVSQHPSPGVSGVSLVGSGAGQSAIADGSGGSVWATPQSAARGLPLVATRCHQPLVTPFPNSFTQQLTSRIGHAALVACSDIRVVYGAPDGSEVDLQNSLIVKAAIDVPVITTLTAQLTPGGGAITSLPVVATTGYIPSGASVQLYDPNGKSSVFTTTAVKTPGAVAITIASQTPGWTFPIGTQVTVSVIYPLTFAGKSVGTVDYPNGILISDPLPVELSAGQKFYTRNYVSVPWTVGGTFGTTLAAASSIGATNLAVVAGPPAGTSFPQQVLVDTAGNQESVTVSGVTTTQTTLTTGLTSGAAITSLAVAALPNALPNKAAVTVTDGVTPQTFVLSSSAAQGATSVAVTSQNAAANYAVGALVTSINAACAATTFAHAAAVAVAQAVPLNIQTISDNFDSYAYPGDLAYSGNFGNINNDSTTLSGSVIAGATSIVTAATMTFTDPNPTINIDTAGTTETIAVLSNGAANTIYLATPLANPHTSGVTCTSSSTQTPAWGPYSIHAERVQTKLKAIVVIGDSIALGNGNTVRSLLWSGITMALEGVRPYLSGAKNGDSNGNYVFDVLSRRRRRLLNIAAGPWGGWAIFQYGANEFTQPLSLLQSNASTTISALRLHGFKIAITTLVPRTTSTDGWTTTVNQTTITGEATRLLYNQWVRGGAGGLADVVIDCAAAVDSGLVAAGAESGLWAISSAIPTTFDGTHANYLGYKLIEAKVTAALPSMT